MSPGTTLEEPEAGDDVMAIFPTASHSQRSCTGDSRRFHDPPPRQRAKTQPPCHVFPRRFRFSGSRSSVFRVLDGGHGTGPAVSTGVGRPGLTGTRVRQRPRAPGRLLAALLGRSQTNCRPCTLLAQGCWLRPGSVPAAAAGAWGLGCGRAAGTAQASVDADSHGSVS